MRIHSLPLAAFALLLAGCASTVLDPLIQERTESAQSRVEMARAPAPTRQQDPLEITDSVWLGDSAVPLKSGSPLPERWLKDNAIALRSDNPLILSQLTGIISSQTRIPVRLTDGADQLGVSAAPAANSGGASAPAAPGGGGASSVPSGALPPGMLVSFEGPLPDLLDMVTSYFNVYWSYDGSSITISRFQTRTFALDALPGTIAVAAPQSTGASGTAGGSAAAQPLATANIDIWEDIRHTVADIVGQEGSVNISQSSGTVVVSTTGDRMERIAAFIQEENRRLSRQVAITIELYTVKIDDAESYGLDSLNLALKMAGNIVDLGPISGVPSGLASSDSTPGSMAFTILNPGAVAGTTGVFQALSTLGKTTRVAQIPITTLNNRPANQRIAVDQAYVSAVSTTTTGGSTGAVSTDVTTDTVTTGISVSILPRLMADNRILLQYALAQGELLRLRNFAAGDNTIQLPETQGLSFSQQVMLRNGSTLILAGFDQSDADSSAAGVGRPLTWALGGSTGSTRARQLVVIGITPREIVVNRREAS